MIDWASLPIVGAVSVGATALFALLLALSIRLRYPSRGAANPNHPGRASMLTGWALLAVLGVVIVIGIWLMIPHFD